MSKKMKIKELKPKIKIIKTLAKGEEVKESNKLLESRLQSEELPTEGHSIVLDQRGRIASSSPQLPQARPVETDADEFKSYEVRAGDQDATHKYEERVRTTSVPQARQILDQSPTFRAEEKFRNQELAGIHVEEHRKKYEEKIEADEFKPKRRQAWEG